MFLSIRQSSVRINFQELDQLEVPSKRRNPLLADVFSRLDLRECNGSGFEKVLTAYQKQVNFKSSRTFRSRSSLEKVSGVAFRARTSWRRDDYQ